MMREVTHGDQILSLNHQLQEQMDWEEVDKANRQFRGRQRAQSGPPGAILTDR